MTATHLYRGTPSGEILDADRKVVGRIVPIPPTPNPALCAEANKPGGCQLHNVHCAYPKCQLPKAKAAPADWSAVAVRVPEPVAFAVESLFDGEQVHRDIYRERAHAERWQQNDGGVVVPLVSLDAIMGAK